jgi:hypothetical protein
VDPRRGRTARRPDEAVADAPPADRLRQRHGLILPDTRHLKWNEVSGWTRSASQTEERTIASISADAKVITLNQALQFDHLGARDNGGTGTLRLLPHVGNLTRNVIVRSQVPIGSGGPQGHILFTERADVDIRYAAFRDLGRTNAAPTGSSNPIGRYPMHFHHLMGPVSTPANGYQYTFVGNAIDGGSTNHQRRWGVAIHNTHYGLVSDNVAYNYAGSLFTTEDGSESYNVIERNFAVRSHGSGGRLGDGNEGMGFWFRGPNNYVRGNGAAHFDSDETEAAYGFKYFMRLLGTVRIPTAKGQDPAQYVSRDGNNMPILEFKNNEVYSSAQGLTYWWLSSQDPGAPPNPQESVFEDLRIWHVYNAGVYHYPAANVRFERLLVLGKDPASSACCKRGWHGEDYAAKDIRIINSEIRGMGTGVIPSAAGTGLQTIENSLLRNDVDILVRTMYSANGPGWLPPRKIVVMNTRLLGNRSFTMDWNADAQNNTTQRDELLVYGYQDNSSDNFRVYYTEQGTQNVAGGLAPCQGGRPEIGGIVCPISGAGTPTVTSLSPTTGDDGGGTSVTINGSNFATGAKVSFGGPSARQVVVNSATRITATSPVYEPGAVDVTVYNTDGRSATLTNAYTFTNSGACTYSISPTSSTVGSAASTGSVSVASGAGCAWTASSDAGWITITSGASGSGNGTVGYSVATNTSSSSRTGTLSVAGKTYTVTQQGATCSYAVSPTSDSAPAAGGAKSATVTAGSGCAWTATSNASWITVTSGSGTGNGTVSYTVAANSTTASRTGTLTVAGQTITVTQAGTSCSYTVSPTSNSAPAAGETASVTVTTTAGCTWTAASNATWITVTAGSSGNGNGTVSYNLAANGSTTSRSGTLTVAGQTVTVSQAGTACSYTVSPTTDSAPAGGEAASVTVTAPAGCGWTAISNVPWIGVTSTPNGSGNGTVNYTVDPHTGTSARTGTLSVAGQTVTVTQQAAVAGTAGVISISFVDSGTSMGAGETAGVVAKPNWNNATGATRTTPLGLTHDTGAATGATVTWVSDNVWSTPIADQAGNRRFTKGYLDTGFGNPTTVTVAGLPSGAYDIYVYVDGDNGSASRTAAYQISGAGVTTTTVNLTDAPNTNFSATFTQANNSAGNYVKFSINAGGFTLTATPGAASTATIRAPVNGIQIVASAPPAPLAPDIGINFVGSGVSMGAAETAGVVPKANWNNALGATRSTPLTLTDDAGAATAATVTWSADNVWSTPVMDQAGNRRLMKGYLDNGFSNAITVTVAGLPAAAYDVYVYVDGDNGAATRTGAYQISGADVTTTTVNATDAANTNFDTTFPQANNSPGNYVKFSITASGFTVTATPGTASTATIRSPINAIQIVAR